MKSKLDNHPQPDTIRVSYLLQLANEEMYDHPTLSSQYAFEAKSISEKLNYFSGVARAYRLLGNSFWAQANQSAALDNFLHGLKVADSIGDVQVQADLAGNLGMVYNDINDYATALKDYKTSLFKQIQLKNKLREAIMRVNVGNGYYHLKRYDSSLYYYHEALSAFQNLNNTKTLIDLVTIGIGDVYIDKGDYAKALSYLVQAKKSCDITRHHRGMVHSRISIAKVRMNQREYLLAEKELKECIPLARSVNLKTYVRDAYELLAKATEAQGHLSEYIRYFKLYTSYKDSIQESAQASKIASLQLEYQMQRKELEIDVLKKDALLKERELKSKNILLVSSAAGIFLIVLFLASVLANYRKQKNLNKKLTGQNEEILRQKLELSKQHDELLSLNEEIRAQQDEVVSQRDELSQRSDHIEGLHKKLLEANQNLEKLVEQRTASLQEQNKKLEEYAFINAHKLRAPVANILGLINILELKHLEVERSEILQHLKKSSWELDQVIRSIGTTLQQGLYMNDPRQNPDRES